MLLRRFTLHVKEQNWIAVMLDVFVVVIGIYIGLQAAEWSNNRKDAELEKSYIQRIINDLDEDIRYTKRLEGASTFMIKRIKSFEAILKDKSARIEKPYEFAQTVRIMSWFFPWQIHSESFDEVTSTGKLAIIQSPAIRSSLNRYYKAFDSIKHWQQPVTALSIEYRKNMTGLLSTEIEVAIRQNKKFDISQEEANLIRQNYVQRQKLVNLIPSMASMHANMSSTQNVTGQKASKLKLELESYLATL